MPRGRFGLRVALFLVDDFRTVLFRVVVFFLAVLVDAFFLAVERRVEVFFFVAIVHS